jgi:hypothetical protein
LENTLQEERFVDIGVGNRFLFGHAIVTVPRDACMVTRTTVRAPADGVNGRKANSCLQL